MEARSETEEELQYVVSDVPFQVPINYSTTVTTTVSTTVLATVKQYFCISPFLSGSDPSVKRSDFTHILRTVEKSESILLPHSSWSLGVTWPRGASRRASLHRVAKPRCCMLLVWTAQCARFGK